MAKVNVLIVGRHRVEDDKLIIGATCTLIESDKKIIVDPGYFIDEEQVVENLAKFGLKTEDIDIVFLTHMHLDHVANIALFKNAKIFCKLKGQGYPGQYHVPKAGYLIRTDIKDGLKLAKDVDFLLTPGHTDDHVSLLVKSDQGMIVIAGDAIAKEILVDLAKKPPLYSNLENYDNSRRKILAVADYIIPGHGDIFKVNK